jgi:hypothetical protein
VHQRAVLAGTCFWRVRDLIRKLFGVLSTRAGYVGEKPASYKSPCRGVSSSIGANDELLDSIDTPGLRKLDFAWRRKNGFEPIATGAAA